MHNLRAGLAWAVYKQAWTMTSWGEGFMRIFGALLRFLEDVSPIAHLDVGRAS